MTGEPEPLKLPSWQAQKWPGLSCELARLQVALELLPERLGTSAGIGEASSSGALDGLLGALEGRKVAPLAVRDVECRRHAALSARESEPARLTPAAPAPRGDTPSAAACKAVLLGDVLHRCVLRVGDRPVDHWVTSRGLLVLVDVEHDQLVDLHVRVLRKPLAVAEDGAQVLRYFEGGANTAAGRLAPLVGDVSGDL
eukprot:scaffold42275_cov34-Phaeocystis_antarctica.AAC.3